jgi:hypothetical protein
MDGASLEKAIAFLVDSPRWLNETRKQSWNNWLGWKDTPADELFGGLARSWASLEFDLLTDFDGITPRLTASHFNMKTPPSDQPGYEALRESFRKLLTDTPTDDLGLGLPRESGH